MKIFRFDREIGKRIDHYNSSGVVISRVAYLLNAVIINCAYLDANSMIGYHRASISQLFLAVQGQGWVRSEAQEKIPIMAGQAVYWQKDEWHESGTETGMTVIIIEGTNLDPAKLMPPV